MTARRSSIAMRCGRKPTDARAAAISCPKRPSSPSLSRWRPSASMALSSRRSLIPRPISSCSGRYRQRRQARKQEAAPSRCGCGRTRILRQRWRLSAGSAGSARAKLHGGVGSIIGARFADRPHRRALCDRTGCCDRASSLPAQTARCEATLDVALVDYLGGLAEGRLTRGDNPVLMTMELVLEVLGEATRP